VQSEENEMGLEVKKRKTDRNSELFNLRVLLS